ncbi:hypothetical protein [Streptomyces sp. Tu 6176]|uniref:hypothetical protein n=1 Tax=Streptomyces sp. Tu 6176 TaxID=1470557 RepID=UPI000AD83659|nr:hypothetical protein [Streptomyces sp. Tu 6176]
MCTLGTPFQGSAAAALILNTGRGTPVPLPHGRLRDLAVTLPGLHDLLPTFPCLDEGLNVRRLTTVDIADLGGDKDLASASLAFHERLRGRTLPGHRAVVGISQRTVQSLALRQGVVEPYEHSFRRHSDGELMRDADGVPRRFDVAGDGTVHRESAALSRATVPLALQHGALAKGEAALEAVTAFLEEDEHLGPRRPPRVWDCGCRTWSRPALAGRCGCTARTARRGWSARSRRSRRRACRAASVRGPRWRPTSTATRTSWPGG